MNTLKDRLKAIRGSKTQASFSAEIGIPLTTLGRYERGDNPPDVGHIITICNKCNIMSDWLLLGKGPMCPGEPLQSAETASQQPAMPVETLICARCAKLEGKLDKVEQQRDELVEENRKLWKENAELREKCATLTERQKTCYSELQLFEKNSNIQPNRATSE